MTRLIRRDGRNDLQNSETERAPELGGRIKDRTSDSLGIIWENIRDHDESDGEKGIYANWLEELRDKGIAPVWPGGLDDGHEQRSAGAEN